MPQDPPRRPPTHGGDSRDRRHRESSGVVAQHIAHEPTPPPVKLPRTPTPDDVRDKLNELTEAVGRVWDARNVCDRLDKIETKLDGWAQTATRNDELVNKVLWPRTQAEMARNDELSQRLSAAERVADSLDRVSLKLDGFADRIGKVEHATSSLASDLAATTAQSRDTAARVSHNTTRIEKLEKRRAADTRELDMHRASQKWWRRHAGKALVGVLVAIGSAVGGALAAYLTQTLGVSP